MGARSRALGTRFESEVRDYLRGRGEHWTADRGSQRRKNHTDPDVRAACSGERAILTQLEGKNRETMPAKCDLDALEQAEVCPWPGIKAAVIKVRGKGARHAMVCMRLETFAELIEAAARVKT